MNGEPFERLCIIGLGLIGGSIGMAAIEHGLARHVCGYDRSPSNAELAVELKAVHEVCASAPEAAAGCDLVFIATPVGSVTSTFTEISDSLQKDATVSDVGSTKAAVVAAISPTVPSHVNYVGGHPIAGSEQTGVEAASGSLFKGAAWVFTPTQTADEGSRARLAGFVSSLGARVVEMQPEEHDRILAMISHLPQIIASSLMAYAADDPIVGGKVGELAAGGFRDMTRVAASPPQLWVDILRSNHEQAGAILEGFVKKLEKVTGLVQAGGWIELEALLTDANSARSNLPEKVGATATAWVPVLVNVPDRPGVLAQLTRVVAEAGVNIEDMVITHVEGSRGLIQLLVDGVEAARRAQTALRDDGLEAHVGPGTGA